MTDLSADAMQSASDLLVTHWREGRHLDALPGHLRPPTRTDGYAIQALVERASVLPLRGWKIAATSAAGQRHINVEGPLAGRLLAERIVPEGTPVSLGANRMRVAEVEFVFRMGWTLSPRPEVYTTDEVMAAVAGLHLGIEIPDSRFLDFTAVGAPQLIADNACADQFVLGPEVSASWRDRDLAAHAVQGWTTRDRVHEGRGSNVMGDPRTALAWLANELSHHGIGLAAGQIVTTGTCVVPVPIAAGDLVVGDYGDYGSLQVRFIA